MKVAALDLGTNSFLCLIAEVQGGQIVKVYSDKVKVTRLGQDVNKTKKFHPEALARAKTCLKEFRIEIEKQKPDRILAMATSAARDVTNAAELFKIGEELQIPIEIIPGHREADITFQGATSAIPKDGKSRLVIDVGGGSTEFILGSDHRVEVSQSVDIGAVRLTESCISSQPATAEELKKLDQIIFDRTEEIFRKIKTRKVDEVIAVAGTPSAIAAIELGGFRAEDVDGFSLTKEKLMEWSEVFAKTSVHEKMQKYHIEAGRADVILAGTRILWKSLEALEISKMSVSIKGVRYGVALELARRIM